MLKVHAQWMMMIHAMISEEDKKAYCYYLTKNVEKIRFLLKIGDPYSNRLFLFFMNIFLNFFSVVIQFVLD
jgi:hypothetical protein